MNTIIAVDPGDMCGWSFITLNGGGWDPNMVTAGQAPFDDWEDWCSVNVNAECRLVVEKFTITQRTAKLSAQPRAIKVTGVMEFIARKTGATFDDSQTPSAAKRFATDAQLRKVGLWKPGQDHTRDAIRHLLLAIVTHGTGQAREELLQSLV